MDVDNPSPRLRNAFLEIQEAPTVFEALELLRRAYPVDYVTYHLAQTISDVVDAPFVRTNYPDAWVARYLLNNYVKVDPVVREGLLRQMPFDWREIEVPGNAVGFLRDAIQHGIGANGYSIPIVDKSRRALLSVNAKAANDDWTTVISACRSEWMELAFLIHKKAIWENYGENDPIPQLSRREIECLHWSALGNDAKGVATILGISEHTTLSYIKSARLKLGCLTKSAATARATQLRIITPYGSSNV